MDRRNSFRHDLQLNCRIGSGRMHAASARALTENFSRTGILVRWLDGTPLPEVGIRLTLDVHLPGNLEMNLRVMRCRATVVRVIPGPDQKHEVALRIHHMRFVAARPVTIFDLAAMPIPKNLVM
jgi:c-di-GMP-binding flagellar brake protein YcgR